MCRSPNPTISLVYETSVTDHHALILQMNYNADYPKKIFFENITKQTYDYAKIQKEISDMDWSTVYKEKDVNIATESLIQQIQTVINTNCTVKPFKLRHKEKTYKPWITKGLIFCIHRRDKLHAASRRNPDNLDLKNRFKLYRNLCNKLIHNTKVRYYKNQLDKVNGDPKKTWKIINEIANRIRAKHTIDQLIDGNETISRDTSPQRLADYINKHFTNVGHNLAQKIQKRITHTRHLPPSIDYPVSLFLTPTTPYEIIQTIGSLKLDSAPGIDNLNSRIFKLSKRELSCPISHIVNSSFKAGIFPDILKCAKVIPILKNGDKLNIDNYRPISLLSTLSKIIEKVVKKRLSKYLQENNIISNNQFGFREGMGTTDAIAEVTSVIYDNVDKRKKCLAVFLDLAKAFDTVSHDKLLQRLGNVGFRGITLGWFTSYLTNRKQIITVNNTNSKPEYLQYGVPQGTVLGPILFLIYINNLSNLVGKTISFADDTVVIFEGYNWNETFSVANEGINEVHEWLDNSLLSLNINKTKYLTFSNNSKGQPHLSHRLTIHDCDRNTQHCNCTTLKRAQQVQYLGITIDYKMRWQPHIDKLTMKVRKLACIFREIRDIVDPGTLKNTYYALCQSILCYGIIGWGGCAKSTLHPLEVAQKCILKIIARKPYRFPSDTLYIQSKVLDVRQLYIRLALIYTKTKMTPNNQRVGKTRATKTGDMMVPRTYTAFGQRHFTFIGPRMYNYLPEATGPFLRIGYVGCSLGARTTKGPAPQKKWEKKSYIGNCMA